MKNDDIKEARKKAALDYHEFPTPGKLSITATKQLLNQSDLALAYSPGVAAACEAIVEDPLNVFRFTARGNLVGVITNGTAVLGLGAIGPLAAKPVFRPRECKKEGKKEGEKALSCFAPTATGFPTGWKKSC